MLVPRCVDWSHMISRSDQSMQLADLCDYKLIKMCPVICRRPSITIFSSRATTQEPQLEPGSNRFELHTYAEHY